MKLAELPKDEQHEITRQVAKLLMAAVVNQNSKLPLRWKQAVIYARKYLAGDSVPGLDGTPWITITYHKYSSRRMYSRIVSINLPAREGLPIGDSVIRMRQMLPEEMPGELLGIIGNHPNGLLVTIK